MEHKLEKNGKFGIYREMNDLPDELVILDNQPKVSEDNDSEIKFVEIEENKDKFFTLSKVEKVTPVIPVESVQPVEKVTPVIPVESVQPVERVTPVTPVGSDTSSGSYHTTFSFQKDIKTGKKIFTKISRRGNNNERERIMIERGDFSQHEGSQNSQFIEIDENEAKQEQFPPHNSHR